MPLYRLLPVLLLLSACSFLEPYEEPTGEAASAPAAAEESIPQEAPAQMEETPAPTEQGEPSPVVEEEQPAAPMEPVAPEEPAPAAETEAPPAEEPPVAAEPSATEEQPIAAEPPVAEEPPAVFETPAAPETSAPRMANLPQRGMTMKDVVAVFGEPERKLAAVGKPPITRWIYADYIVYFEHSEVIQAVPKELP